MGWLKGVGVVLLVIVVVVAAAGGAVFTGGVESPTAGFEDIGDWGEVTDDRTEVITTIWIQNPNPLGVQISDALGVEYTLTLNDVALAEGSRNGITIQNGNNTVEQSTSILNENIATWWVNYIQANETINAKANARLNVGVAGLTYSMYIRESRTQFEDKTPVITAVDSAVSEFEDESKYPMRTTVSAKDVPSRLRPPSGFADRSVTVDYDIEEVSAEWGSVNSDQTTMLIRMRVRNSGDIGVPPAEHLGASVELNDVSLLRLDGDAFTPRDVSRDTVLEPGETQTIVYELQMDNDRVDEWFTSHIRRSERSNVEVNVFMEFGIDKLDVSFRLPQDDTIQYECSFRTGILVDGRQNAASTNCGSGGSLSVGGATADIGDGSSSASDSTPTDNSPIVSRPTSTDVPTVPQRDSRDGGSGDSSSEPSDRSPSAEADASPTSGEAELEVEFDASGSSDPDNDIEEYIWRFKDGSAPARGETVTHTFRSAGNYQVELVVVDSQGNRDTATITIDVERRQLR